MKADTLYNVLKSRARPYDPASVARLLQSISQSRVEALAARLAAYIQGNVPAAFEKREGLADYKTNPYVMMTSAAVGGYSDPNRLAEFLFGSKLYMALETSFGKSVESTFVSQYPIVGANKWVDAPEKIAESSALAGLDRQEKAQRRLDSVWREIDKSVVVGRRRFLVSIKSGPNTINDTQVQAMADAILDRHAAWAKTTRKNYPAVRELDIVIGLTYGTDKTTNNKENQILAKLLRRGFVEEDRKSKPGVLIDEKSRSIRVYRHIGQDFWAFIGNPAGPSAAQFVFLEVLLALAKALSESKTRTVEERINAKMRELSTALAKLTFPRESLPKWVRNGFSEDSLFWFNLAVSTFFDEGA